MNLAVMVMVFQLYRARLAVLRADPDQGSVTLEKVVITALLVAGAIAVGTVLVAKATGTAESIDTP
jgi:hypothetical protein